MSKRAREESCDEDDDLWTQACKAEEALLSKSQLPSEILPSPHGLSGVSQTQGFRPPVNKPVGTDVNPLQMRVQNLQRELQKKSKETLDLRKQLKEMKQEQCSGRQNSCQRTIAALTTDLKFRQNELMSFHQKNKSPTKKIEATELNSVVILTDIDSPQSLYKLPAIRSFPKLNPIRFTSNATYENFSRTECNDPVASAKFKEWCQTRPDQPPSASYIETVSILFPVVLKKCLQSKDETLIDFVLEFIVHMSDFSPLNVHLHLAVIIQQSHCHLTTLISVLHILLIEEPHNNPVELLTFSCAYIVNEDNWQTPQFDDLLVRIIYLLKVLHLTSSEAVALAKGVLRVTQHRLNMDFDKGIFELIITNCCVLWVSRNYSLEPELSALIIRAEAFHHLGSVLKIVIRWLPSLSLTGCPEMNDRLEESFRD